MEKQGYIAFITTPHYRDNRSREIERFVFGHLHSLCTWFHIISTGRTYDYIMEIVNRPFEELSQEASLLIERDMGGLSISDNKDLARWRATITGPEGLSKKLGSIQGMIEVTYNLVEGRLDAIIHLTDWDDVIGKPDTMVLKRQANVHDVPLATNLETAEHFARIWVSKARRVETSTEKNPDPVFSKRKDLKEAVIKGLKPGHKVLALIVHDEMKLDMCLFVVEHAEQIFRQFNFILATGTTGDWIKKFAKAAGRDKKLVDRKVRCCLTGPDGGDIQIAAAAVKKLCHKVIFLQDPGTSHAHETDIRLFEQALLFEHAAIDGGIDIKIASNISTAIDLLNE